VEQPFNKTETFHVEHKNSAPESCVVCGNTALFETLICPDHFLSKELFALFLCKNCLTLSTWPQPSPDKIFSYYSSEEYVSHNDSKKGFVNQLYHLVKSGALKNKVKLVQSYLGNNALLDYGCGTGDFVAACAASNISVKGVEPDSGARLVAQNKGLNIIEPGSINHTKTRFGVITMWHVLEHTYSPVNTINQLKSLLAEDGRLIVAVPNYKAYDAAFYKSFWAAYDVPRHLFHFAPQSITAICKATGMTLDKTLPMYYDSFYVSMLSEKYKNGSMVTGVLNGAISNLKALKTNNYSSLIYILKK
jgi:2-polyprenyl-3-methyl-5-hydroxy-6-metoxy-1,4-benzoquinol methylase